MYKLVVASVVFLLVTLGGHSDGFGEQAPGPRGELRVVDNDPGNWVHVTFNVFEHLIELDTEGRLVPGLATGWQWLDDRTLEVTLRHGVTFHNGERFDADIVKLNWEENLRLRQPHLAGEFLNFKPGSRLEIHDPYTVRFVFPEPDGGALVKLLYMHLANRQFYRDVGWGETLW
jgi:ABC-type transport system substrate-binding protein